MSVMKMAVLLLFMSFLSALSSYTSHAQDDLSDMDLIDNVKTRGHVPMSPSQAIEAARLGKLLDKLYADCGRYPTTQEGLKALMSKPKTLKCKSWGIKNADETRPYLNSIPMGWKYISENGTAYTIEPLK